MCHTYIDLGLNCFDSYQYIENSSIEAIWRTARVRLALGSECGVQEDITVA